MQTKPLLYGLAGFFIGGFIVALTSTTFDKPEESSINASNNMMSMSNSVATLKDKQGDEYDETFISEMIAHHQSAVDMAKLSGSNAKHDEIQELSKEIIAAQEKEITQMKQWQKDWGYNTSANHNMSAH